MIATPEKGAIISGIGISRIGRRTGIPHVELTVESSRRARCGRRTRYRPDKRDHLLRRHDSSSGIRGAGHRSCLYGRRV